MEMSPNIYLSFPGVVMVFDFCLPLPVEMVVDIYLPLPFVLSHQSGSCEIHTADHNRHGDHLLLETETGAATTASRGLQAGDCPAPQ